MLFPSICQSLLRHDHSLGLDRFPFHQELEPLTWGISALGAFFFFDFCLFNALAALEEMKLQQRKVQHSSRTVRSSQWVQGPAAHHPSHWGHSTWKGTETGMSPAGREQSSKDEG